GYTALARKNINDPEAVARYLTKIDEAGDQILDLIKKVLEVSDKEAHDFLVKESECDITEIVSEIYSSLLPSATQKNVAVTLRTRALTNTHVFADKDKLKQMLTHIASNAVKFNKEGGSVTLTVTEAKANEEFATFRFVCEDTGVGMKPEFLQRIFRPFERESNSTSSGRFGAGLGLAIAKYTADIMGGTISVDSVEGKGSKFTVSIAFRICNSDKLPEGTFEETDLTGKRILLVEDNEMNLEIETEILEDYGFLVDTAKNGKISVDKVTASEAGYYALILMDIQMPVMNGWEATAAIRHLPDPDLAQIPIIALSANALESDKRASIETGMDAHLAKPLDVPLLIKTIAKVLSGRKINK
ncbi:MAG: response regulator, partial [Clostridia bacterium]|nr:response regulator [Clostridia bacterium]